MLTFAGAAHTHVVPAGHVDRLVAATVKLHHDPGVNPTSQIPTVPLLRITASEFYARGPFWWTTPDLGGHKCPTGALLFGPDPSTTTILWEAPGAKDITDDAVEIEGPRLLPPAQDGL